MESTCYCVQGGIEGLLWTVDGKIVSAVSCRKVFSAGASHYGVADCELLAKETHKFESRYLDSLIGCEAFHLTVLCMSQYVPTMHVQQR